MLEGRAWVRGVVRMIVGRMRNWRRMFVEDC